MKSKGKSLVIFRYTYRQNIELQLEAWNNADDTFLAVFSLLDERTYNTATPRRSVGRYWLLLLRLHPFSFIHYRQPAVGGHCCFYVTARPPC